MLGEVEIIMWPDAEKAVGAFLRKELVDTMGWPTGTVRVSTKLQVGTHVQVLRTGGTTRDIVWDDAQITLDCRDAEGVNAAKLAGDCRALMLAAGRDGVLAGHEIGAVDAFAAPQNNPDPTTDAARYSATYTVPFRGTTERTI